MEKEIRFTLKKCEKLRREKEFKNVFEKGKCFVGSFFVIYYTQNSEDTPRAGFISSKKISGKAVVRNRARRLLREVFRLNKHILKPYDFIFIARKGIIGTQYKDVEKEFLEFVDKHNLRSKTR